MLKITLKVLWLSAFIALLTALYFSKTGEISLECLAWNINAVILWIYVWFVPKPK
jgi:hypothetical protein